MRKAAERRAVRDYRREQQMISKAFNDAARPYNSYQSNMMLVQQEHQQRQHSPLPAVPLSSPDPSVAPHHLSPYAASFEPHNAKVSIAGNGGPPFEIVVENIPPSMTLDQLVSTYQYYGEIIGASLRASFGELSRGGRTCYGRLRFSNHHGMAAAVLGHHTPTSSNVVSRPPNQYGLWKPKSTARPASVPAAGLAQVSATQSVEGTLSSWTDSLGGAFTPTRRDSHCRQSNHAPPGF